MDKPKIIKRKKYTLDEKIQALRLLKENNYEFGITEKETGINRANLHVWLEKYASEIDTSIVSAIAKDAEVKISQYKDRYFKTHYQELSDATSLAIARAKALLTTEEDLNKVNGTIKVLCDMITKLGQVQEQSTGTSTTNIVRQSIIQLNQIYEKHKND